MADLCTQLAVQRPVAALGCRIRLPRYKDVEKRVQGSPGMSTICVTDEIAAALRASMSPCDRIAGWTFRWSVQCGQIICQQCQASQSANQACEPFVHRPGCCARREGFPWRELSTLLGGAQQPSWALPR